MKAGNNLFAIMFARGKLYGMFCLALICLTGCHKNTTTFSAPEDVSSSYPAVHLSKYGIGCFSFEDNTHAGPPSFSLSDIGKPGVETLTAYQITQAHRVQNYFKSKTLRFSIFSQGKKYEEFAIYDASQGPCPPSGVRYTILNQAGWQYYQPGENQFGPGNYLGEGKSSSRPYPWITPSR